MEGGPNLGGGRGGVGEEGGESSGMAHGWDGVGWGGEGGEELA